MSIGVMKDLKLRDLHPRVFIIAQRDISIPSPFLWENKLHPENNQDFANGTLLFFKCDLENYLFRGVGVKSVFSFCCGRRMQNIDNNHFTQQDRL